MTVISANPVLLPVPGRDPDLRVKVSAPAHGANLPVVLFSHGYGSSGDLYQPLAEHWAEHGFVVLQPTYLDSRAIGLTHDDPRAPHLWRSRRDDAVHVLDALTTLIDAVPGLSGRVDVSRIAAAGHSFGGQTTGLLLGLRVHEPAGTGEDLSDPRVRAGILLATAGRGGADLAPGMLERLPWLNVSFGEMAAPALVVYGARDDSVLTTRGPDWGADPYHLAPAPKVLVRFDELQHSLGGAVGYESFETTDANPAAVALLQRLTTAYLQTVLAVDAESWSRASVDLPHDVAAHLEQKST